MHFRAPIAPSELLLWMTILKNFQSPPPQTPPVVSPRSPPDFLDIRPRPSANVEHLAQGLHDPSQVPPHVLPPHHAPIKKRVRTTSPKAHASMPKKPCVESPRNGDSPLPQDEGRTVKVKQSRRRSKTKDVDGARESKRRGKVNFNAQEVALDGHTYLTSRKVTGSDISRSQCALPSEARDKLKKHLNTEMKADGLYQYLDKDGNCYEAFYKEWKSAESLHHHQSFKAFYNKNNINANDILHIYIVNDKSSIDEPHSSESPREKSLKFRLIKSIHSLEYPKEATKHTHMEVQEHCLYFPCQDETQINLGNEEELMNEEDEEATDLA